jgi:hypothetical protein
MRTLARRLYHELKTVVARSPAVAIPIARLRHGVPVDGGTEIVIEGFPRTGTSFAVAAFRLAQPRPVAVACHVHAPAQVIAGVRRGLPVLLCVRDPEETVLSYAVRNPHLTLRQALRSYLRFYEPLLRHRAGVVVAPFERITTDLGGLILEVNARFGTDFAPFEHTEENVRACFEQIDEDYRRRVSGLAFERQVARPSPVRERMKEELREAYRGPALAGVRARADAAYRALAGPAGASPRPAGASPGPGDG